jgi:hypothetical protein
VSTFTRSWYAQPPRPADRNDVEAVPEKRMGDRLVIASRPPVQLRTARRGVFGRKTATTDAQLVQVSVTGALVVTDRPIPEVDIGARMDIILQRRRSTAIVRRVVLHHDMALYGVELREIDPWMQALIDRAILEDRGDVRTLWPQAR